MGGETVENCGSWTVWCLGKLEFVIYLCKLNERQPEILMWCVLVDRKSVIFHTATSRQCVQPDCVRGIVRMASCRVDSRGANVLRAHFAGYTPKGKRMINLFLMQILRQFESRFSQIRSVAEQREACKWSEGEDENHTYECRLIVFYFVLFSGSVFSPSHHRRPHWQANAAAQHAAESSQRFEFGLHFASF